MHRARAGPGGVKARSTSICERAQLAVGDDQEVAAAAGRIEKVRLAQDAPGSRAPGARLAGAILESVQDAGKPRPRRSRGRGGRMTLRNILFGSCNARPSRAGALGVHHRLESASRRSVGRRSGSQSNAQRAQAASRAWRCREIGECGSAPLKRSPFDVGKVRRWSASSVGLRRSGGVSSTLEQVGQFRRAYVEPSSEVGGSARVVPHMWRRSSQMPVSSAKKAEDDPGDGRP